MASLKAGTISLRSHYWLIIAVILLAILPTPTRAGAAALTNRSVTLSDSKQSAVTSNHFKFTIPSYSNIGSIEFEYCDNTPFPNMPCTAPTGLSVQNAVLSSQTGETGFVLDAPTVNELVLSRPSSAGTPIPVSYTFDNIINPSEPNLPVYVRISTFASGDATGPSNDTGAVVFSTSRNITVSGYVPPYLIFCVGVTVETNCSSSSGDLLNFGELSTTQTRALTSQYSGSTNDPGGYTTTLSGVTMTSGNNIIPAMTAQDVSRAGAGQFGMNLRANSSPGVGSDPSGPGSSVPVAAFSMPNRYIFQNGIISGSSTATDYKKFTASYIVNVANGQRPGVYSTTLTYIATAAF